MATVTAIKPQGFKAEFTALEAVCIDIETGHAPESEIQAELALWKPPANIKDAEKIEQRRADAEQRIREKSALLCDSSPIVSVAIAFGDGVGVFHTLQVEDDDHDGFYSIKAATELNMLISLRTWMDGKTDESTEVIGFNLGFDLPRLRVAYARHELRLPRLLVPRNGMDITDVMKIWCYAFTTKDTKFVSLDEVCKRLGIAPEGKLMSGADVPHAALDPGQHLDIVTYNAIDTLLTWRAAQIITGRAGN